MCDLLLELCHLLGDLGHLLASRCNRLLRQLEAILGRGLASARALEGRPGPIEALAQRAEVANLLAAHIELLLDLVPRQLERGVLRHRLKSGLELPDGLDKLALGPGASSWVGSEGGAAVGGEDEGATGATPTP